MVIINGRFCRGNDKLKQLSSNGILRVKDDKRPMREGRKEEGKVGEEGRNEGRNEERKEGMKDGRMVGKKVGRKSGRMEGRKKVR